jgi:flagellar FliL protein
MSDAPATNTSTENGSTDEPKKSKKLLVIIIVILLVVGGGVGGFFFLRRASSTTKEEAKGKKSKKSKAEKEEPAEGSEESKEEGEPKVKTEKTSDTKSDSISLPDDEEVKHVIELQPFVVNLADVDQARYLRLTVSLGIGEREDGEETPNPIFMTRIRNAILSVLTAKTSEDILTNQGKITLRKELLKATQEASEEPKVVAIYITDFIVQL